MENDLVENRPPKPKLALTLGITGHRLHRVALPGDPGGATPAGAPSIQEAQVRAAIDGVLSLLVDTLGDMRHRFQDWFEDATPIIALTSSLAEGSDRIAAQAALAKNMPVDVVLPCARARYEQTFDDDASRQEFAGLFDKARATLTLQLAVDANTEQSLGRAYELAGLTVLAQSDILIAVWDGEPPRGRGGTAEIVDEAARLGTPIVVIDPNGGEPRLLWDGGRSVRVPVRHAADLPVVDIGVGIRTVVVGLVEPPASKHETDGMKMYLDSPLDGHFHHVGWKLLRFVAGLDRRSQPVAVARPAPRTKPQAQLEPESNRVAEARMDAAGHAASKIADQHAHAFRTAYVVNFLVGALAVFFVAMSIILKSIALGETVQRHGHAGLVTAELSCVGFVVIYLFVASREQWHRRWFEAREVAERLRVSRPFWVVGIWPHNLAANQPAWTGWYVRAILREQPVYADDLNSSFSDAKNVLWNLVEGQIAYHKRNIDDMEHLERRLTHIGTICLGLTVIGAVMFIIVHMEITALVEALVTALAVFLPALATSVYGIRLIGDFEDSVRRSKRTLSMLTILERSLEGEVDDLPALRACARVAADAMLADVDAWRVAVESRNLGAA
jgi:hypothetical protein